MINDQVKIYIGTNEWGRKEWIGNLYPATIRSSEFLQYYSETFNFVELKATYYQYEAALLQRWLATVAGKAFKFCPWIPANCFADGTAETHIKRMNAFLLSFEAYKKYLGSAIITIEKKYSERNKDYVFQLIELIPKHISAFIQFYDEDWYEEKIFSEVLNYADAHNAGLLLKNIAYINKVSSREIYLRLNTDVTIDEEIINAIKKDNTTAIYISISGRDKKLVTAKLLQLKGDLAPRS